MHEIKEIDYDTRSGYKYITIKKKKPFTRWKGNFFSLLANEYIDKPNKNIIVYNKGIIIENIKRK